MNSHKLISDQYITWADKHAGQTFIQPATTPHKPPAATAPFGRHCPRLADRALQTLWQARLQMCQRAWARSQVLSLHQSSRQTPANGLCSPGLPGAGKAVPGQLSTRPNHPGRDLRHQPRTPAPPRAVITHAGEQPKYPAHRSTRYPSGCDLDRQYARFALRRCQSLPCRTWRKP